MPTFKFAPTSPASAHNWFGFFAVLNGVIDLAVAALPGSRASARRYWDASRMPAMQNSSRHLVHAAAVGLP